MEALSLLLNRTSHARLESPAPEGEELQNIMNAALKAPDHGALAPWRFIVCKNNGLVKLGQIFETAARLSQMSQADVERAAKLPLRAPLVIIAIAEYRESKKVPRIEQICSAACAVHAMQMAALAQSFGGVWRTGSYASNSIVKKELAVKEQDEIVGFLYLGTPSSTSSKKPVKNCKDYFEVWE